jgi:hypothetical protein
MRSFKKNVLSAVLCLRHGKSRLSANILKQAAGALQAEHFPSSRSRVFIDCQVRHVRPVRKIGRRLQEKAQNERRAPNQVIDDLFRKPTAEEWLKSFSFNE